MYDLCKQTNECELSYKTEIAGVLCQHMLDLNQQCSQLLPSLGQQQLLAKGIKVWGDKAKSAALREMDQLHTRVAFSPVHSSKCIESELKKAQVALMFVTEKRDGKIKARTVYNGKPTRIFNHKEEVRSPTVSLEGLMLTMCVDAKEGRDVMTLDVPNAYIQTPMDQPTDGSDRVLMKLEGNLAEMMVELDPDTYGKFIEYHKGKPILYVVVLNALYGILVAAILWYQKFRKDLEGIGFVFNPYDPCVANRTINGKQQTIRFHVDDLMSSHVDSSVNDAFIK